MKRREPEKKNAKCKMKMKMQNSGSDILHFHSLFCILHSFIRNA